MNMILYKININMNYNQFDSEFLRHVELNMYEYKNYKL